MPDEMLGANTSGFVPFFTAAKRPKPFDIALGAPPPKTPTRGPRADLAQRVDEAFARKTRQHTGPPAASAAQEARAAPAYRSTQSQAFDSAQEIFMQLNKDLTVAYISPICHHMWGYTPDEVVGKSVLNLLVSEDRSRAQFVFTQAGSAIAKMSAELRVLHRNGNKINCAWAIYNEGTSGPISSIVTPVAPLIRQEQSYSDLLVMVSHDMISPLNAIRTLLALVHPISDEENTIIRRAQAEMDRLVALVDDLLNLEQMRNGRLTLNKMPLPLSVVLERAVTSVLLLAATRGIDIMMPSTDTVALVDLERMVRVLVTLLTNAIRHASPNSTVEIEVEEMSASIEIRVIDYGSGIDPEDVDNIFWLYTQGRKNSATSPHKERCGLGLAICKAIVEEHGGTIGLESEVGNGTTVWFKIPRAPEELQKLVQNKAGS